MLEYIMHVLVQVYRSQGFQRQYIFLQPLSCL